MTLNSEFLRVLRVSASVLVLTDISKANAQEPLGSQSANPYAIESSSNPYDAGSTYGANSINNAYGKYGSPYSIKSATNPMPPIHPSSTITRAITGES
jgi:hypothetical protein